MKNTFRPPHSRLRWISLLVWSIAGLGALSAPSTHPATGRKIAPVMGASGADWLERPERQSEENVKLALDELRLKPNMVVADIGAGTGYYSIRMAKLVAPGGQVFAVDIQPEMLSRLKI